VSAVVKTTPSYRWQSKECDADECTATGNEFAERRDWHDVAVADSSECRLKTSPSAQLQTIAHYTHHRPPKRIGKRVKCMSLIQFAVVFFGQIDKK
jgi:hypothetical protein